MIVTAWSLNFITVYINTKLLFIWGKLYKNGLKRQTCDIFCPTKHHNNRKKEIFKQNFDKKFLLLLFTPNTENMQEMK